MVRSSRDSARPIRERAGAVPIQPRIRRILATWLTGLAVAATPAAADDPGDASARDERPVWVLPAVPGEPAPPPLTLREEVCEARLRHTAAEARREEAEVAFRRARRDDYPRGVERQLLKEQKIRRVEQARAAAEELAAVEARADDAPLSWQLLEPCPEPGPANAADAADDDARDPS